MKWSIPPSSPPVDLGELEPIPPCPPPDKSPAHSRANPENKQLLTHIHIEGQLSVAASSLGQTRVCGLWEEARLPGGATQGRRCRLQTEKPLPPRGIGTCDLLAAHEVKVRAAV